MSTHRCLLVPLLACLLLGCTRAKPITSEEVHEAVEEGVHKAFDELDKQIEAANKELEEKAVAFLIDGVRDDKHSRELSSKVQGLKDAGTKSRFFDLQGNCYYRNDTYFRVSPLSDLAAAVQKIAFGLVVAVDPAERIVLVDASAKPAARPATG